MNSSESSTGAPLISSFAELEINDELCRGYEFCPDVLITNNIGSVVKLLNGEFKDAIGNIEWGSFENAKAIIYSSGQRPSFESQRSEIEVA